jgi:DNA-directed RNA polymerase subunit M/transcription elongation factor TFIIS
MMSTTSEAEMGSIENQSRVVVDELVNEDGMLLPAEDVGTEPDTEVVEEQRPETEGQVSLSDFSRQTEVAEDESESNSPAVWVEEQRAKTKMVIDETADFELKYPLSEGPDAATQIGSASEATGAECPECGSRRTISQQRQMGGADEGMTGFHQCQECGHQWRSGYGA